MRNGVCEFNNKYLYDYNLNRENEILLSNNKAIIIRYSQLYSNNSISNNSIFLYINKANCISNQYSSVFNICSINDSFYISFFINFK